MPDTCSSEDINAQYRTKIPVFDTHVDDADSEDYLMFKVTHCSSKGIRFSNEHTDVIEVKTWKKVMV